MLYCVIICNFERVKPLILFYQIFNAIYVKLLMIANQIIV